VYAEGVLAFYRSQNASEADAPRPGASALHALVTEARTCQPEAWQQLITLVVQGLAEPAAFDALASAACGLRDSGDDAFERLKVTVDLLAALQRQRASKLAGALLEAGWDRGHFGALLRCLDAYPEPGALEDALAREGIAAARSTDTAACAGGAFEVLARAGRVLWFDPLACERTEEWHQALLAELARLAGGLDGVHFEVHAADRASKRVLAARARGCELRSEIRRAGSRGYEGVETFAFVNGLLRHERSPWRLVQLAPDDDWYPHTDGPAGVQLFACTLGALRLLRGGRLLAFEDDEGASGADR
jgi:hypothetical protein